MEKLANEPIISSSDYNCGFSISTSLKKSQTIEFFDELYTYPPKFKIKWETLGELRDEPFMSYTYRALDNTFPFFNAVNNVFFKKTEQYVQKNQYSADSYFQGFSNRLKATQFYSQKTSTFQKVLKRVPVYTILNGQGEIVLADYLSLNRAYDPQLSKISYNVCGKFDSLIDQTDKLGLFFMSKKDATRYLKEIVSKDPQGTKAYGISLHCVGLDFAYRVMREYNPNIDFRFIPDLNEVQNLLTRSNKSDYNLSFTGEQKYIKFKKMPSLLLDALYTLFPVEIPGHSFLEKVDYFKGVPIYIVKTQARSKSSFLSGILNPLNSLERLRTLVFKGSRIMGIGIGLNSNSKDKIIDTKNKAPTKIFVFFERAGALNFCKNSNLNIVRNLGTGSKVLVSNLEDFLEYLEEDMVENKIFKISSNQKQDVHDEIIEMRASKDSIIEAKHQPIERRKLSKKTIQSFFLYKYQRFQSFLELLLNFN